MPEVHERFNYKANVLTPAQIKERGEKVSLMAHNLVDARKVGSLLDWLDLAHAIDYKFAEESFSSPTACRSSLSACLRHMVRNGRLAKAPGGYYRVLKKKKPRKDASR